METTESVESGLLCMFASCYPVGTKFTHATFQDNTVEITGNVLPFYLVSINDPLPADTPLHKAAEVCCASRYVIDIAGPSLDDASEYLVRHRMAQAVAVSARSLNKDITKAKEGAKFLASFDKECISITISARIMPDERGKCRVSGKTSEGDELTLAEGVCRDAKTDLIHLLDGLLLSAFHNDHEWDIDEELATAFSKIIKK